MANIFRESLTLIQGLGVTIDPNNTPLNAINREEVTISIGNEVGVTSNPIFLSLTPTNEQYQLNEFIIKPNALTGSVSQLGDLTLSSNLNVNSNMRVLGTTFARKIESELSQSFTIFESGSSLFGDTLDDTHRVSGSLLTSGSISLNSTTIQDISNDTSLSDSSSDDVVSENAVKTYVNSLDYENFQTYQRKCFPHTGSFVNQNTSSFTAVSASAPSGVEQTTENDFLFFINGQIIENDGLSIQQDGQNLLLKIDSDSIGYGIDESDEVVGWGKFNS